MPVTRTRNKMKKITPDKGTERDIPMDTDQTPFELDKLKTKFVKQEKGDISRVVKCLIPSVNLPNDSYISEHEKFTPTFVKTEIKEEAIIDDNFPMANQHNENLIGAFENSTTKFVKNEIKDEMVAIYPNPIANQGNESLSTASSSDEIDSDDENVGEKLLHRQKISSQKKLQMIQNLNIKTLSNDLKRKTSSTFTAPKTVSKIKVEKKLKPDTPQRFSARLRKQGLTSLNEENLVAESEANQEIVNKRNVRPEAYKMVGIGYEDDSETDLIRSHDQFMHETLSNRKSTIVSQHTLNKNEKEYKSILHSLKLRENTVKKVVPKRIFSLAIHPRIDETIIAAGDKEGYLGIWDVNNTADANGGIYHFHPHIRPISCLKFSHDDPNKLFMCSYDGILRYADLHASTFSEAVLDDPEYTMSGFEFLSKESDACIVASTYNGDVLVIDRRESKDQRSRIFSSFKKGAKSISVHPKQSQYITVSHLKGVLNIFDLRKFRLGSNKCNPVVSMEAHTSSVNSAQFNPHNGNQILTIGYDDKIKILNSEIISQESVKIISTVNHDNHTGRFLTPFRTYWHPFQQNIFAVGSKRRPQRQIELFNSKLDVVCTLKSEEYLTSINSVIAFHPSKHIIAGGNSSGRIHVFQ